MRLVAALKRALIGLLRSPAATAAVGVLFFACLVWFAGPLVGMIDALPRAMVIAAAVVFWALFVLIDRVRNARGAQLLEQALHEQARDQAASSRPDRRAEVEALKGQFDRAVASLKDSKLGRGRSGRAVLSALPWYMFIGPPGSGKSTALLHSGLQFPSVGEQGRGVRGVGGTRNCDWWFTRDAVLLDTAGRYVTEDDDREEWLAFLDMLKRARRRNALNGVLAAISIADLLEASDEELESHAKKIRARIDELVARLGLVFPVYVLFTKCDLVRGFVEFFEDFSRAEREQIWGGTFPRAGGPDVSSQRFDAEFRRVCESMEVRRMARLASARGSQKIRDIYGFPLQLASGREKLSRFIEVLFEPTPYHETPLFRGFYLTSGTQEGTPIDRILGAVSRASGLSDVISESFETGKESKSYFLRSLFTDVIIPDRALAGSSSAMDKQRGYLRVGMFVGAVTASILAVAGLSVSFVANKQLNASVKAAALHAVQMRAEDERQFAANVALLDGLRARLEQLRDYEDNGLPLRLRGLYRGWALSAPVQDLYVRQFQAMFLSPTRSVMEVDLAGFVANAAKLPADRDADYYYSLLKAYLMLSDPTRLDPAFMNAWLERLWKDALGAQYGQGRVPEGLEDAVVRQLVFYGEQLTRERVPAMTADPRLVVDVQTVLRRIPVEDRAYARARRLGSEGLEFYTLETVLKGRGQDVVSASYRVPGLFTQQGSGAFQQAMATVLERTAEEAWVLGVADPPRVDLESAMEARYVDEYAGHWRAFLEAIQIRRPESVADLAAELDALTKDDSPLTVVLRDVAVQTEFGSRAGAPAGMAASLVQKVKRGLHLDGGEAVAAPEASAHQVSARFRFLRDFLSPSGDGKQPAPFSAYVEELRKVHEAIRPLAESGAGAQSAGVGSNDLSAAVRNTERLVQGFDPEARRIVGGLLVKPVQLALASVTSMAQSDLNKRWRAEVYEPCARGIAGRYPFSSNGDDAAFIDVAEFFHPQEGALWRFYDRDLKALVNEGTERWTPKRQSGGATLSSEFLEQLRRARMISDSLFPRGATDPKVLFDVYPYPMPGATEVLLQVDGNGFRYRNEPQEWHELIWPGSGGSSGAAVQVQAGARASKQFAGRWGLFRLLDSAQVTPAGPSRYRVEWNLSIDGARSVKVRYDLRAQSYKNPFRRGFFNEFRCTAQVG